MNTLYFYDLETSGFSPRSQRIMQFAGQRTDLKLNHIGKPDNYFIKLTDDILPDPGAVLLTGITPQQTISEGISESDFLKVFTSEISLTGTVFVGFNSIRFDDEFMRFLHYRNFYDAYEWHYADGRGRWDILDIVRMTRALRPQGIKWPVDSNGEPVNKLELLSSINKLSHENAHDALSDVNATIAMAQLIRGRQPKLFDYMLDMRGKPKISQLVHSGQPFVYCSGKYSGKFHKTTIVSSLADHPKIAGSLVYDLRHDPTPYLAMSPDKLAELWTHFCKNKPCKHSRLPVKTLQFNRCPAVAPISVIDSASKKNISIDLSDINSNLDKLAGQKVFTSNLIKALEIMDKAQQTRFISDELVVDEQLYDGFVNSSDKPAMSVLRAAEGKELANLDVKFKDARLNGLFPLYKARNFSKFLSDEERDIWEKYRTRKLLSGKDNSKAAIYFKLLSEIAAKTDISDEKRYLLEELQLYGQSILPIVD